MTDIGTFRALNGDILVGEVLDHVDDFFAVRVHTKNGEAIVFEACIYDSERLLPSADIASARECLDALLDEECGTCRRPFKWCECELDLAFDGTEPEHDVVSYLFWGLDSPSVHRQRASMQSYASWWRGQNRRAAA